MFSPEDDLRTVAETGCFRHLLLVIGRQLVSGELIELPILLLTLRK
jgi:hypothetical protein